MINIGKRISYKVVVHQFITRILFVHFLKIYYFHNNYTYFACYGESERVTEKMVGREFLIEVGTIGVEWSNDFWGGWAPVKK